MTDATAKPSELADRIEKVPSYDGRSLLITHILLSSDELAPMPNDDVTQFMVINEEHRDTIVAALRSAPPVAGADAGVMEALKRVRDFPHDGSLSAQGMAAIARDALASTSVRPVEREKLMAMLTDKFPQTFTTFGNGKITNALAANVISAILALLSAEQPVETVERALEADGEKLRQLTGKDHGPHFEAVRYCQKCQCITWHLDEICEWSDMHR